jgi:hypothetical protein
MGLSSLPVLLVEAVPGSGKRLTVGAGFATVLPCLLVGACFYWLYKRNELLPLEVWWREHAPQGFWAVFSEPKASLEGLFPYLGNMLTPWGTFRPNATVAGDRPLLWGLWVRVGLSLVGCVAGAALLARLGRRLRAGAWQGPLTLFTAGHLLILLVPLALWDRYLIVLLPGALYLATDPPAEAGAARKMGWVSRRTAGLVTLAVFGLFSLGLLHDWLSWNAARWALGRRAVARGIPPTHIDGGYEWEGWHFAPDATAPFPARRVLSFSVLENMRAVDREPYDVWLMPGRRQFYLLERAPPAGGGPDDVRRGAGWTVGGARLL